MNQNITVPIEGHGQPIQVAVAVVCREDKFLISKRPNAVHLAGFWEFPGGKVQPGETVAEAAKRELVEELDYRVIPGDLIHQETYRYPEKIVALHFLLCQPADNREPRAVEVDEWRWVSLTELNQVKLPPANRPILEILRKVTNDNQEGHEKK